MDLSATAQFEIHQRATGCLVVRFRHTLAIEIRILSAQDAPRVLIHVSGYLGAQPGVGTGSEKLELAIRQVRGRTVVGAACVEWDEVPLVGLRFIDLPYRRTAEDALWAAYQLFLEVSRDSLEQLATRHAAARVWDGLPVHQPSLQIRPTLPAH